jgi:hypothetical protein
MKSGTTAAGVKGCLLRGKQWRKHARKNRR